MTAGDSAAGRICGPSSALLAMTNPLSALSPLDGRYAAKAAPLRPIFSEFGLMHRRVRVELQWLLALADDAKIDEVRPLSERARAALLANQLDTARTTIESAPETRSVA